MPVDDCRRLKGGFMRNLACSVIVSLFLAFSGTALALANDKDKDNDNEIDGKAIFEKICALCHGPEGEGRPMMGPPLNEKKFQEAHDDEYMRDIIKNGRPIKEKEFKEILITMPPQDLTDTEIDAVIKHLRGLVKEE
jgi:mono/diheme cytochrome c family protein